MKRALGVACSTVLLGCPAQPLGNTDWPWFDVVPYEATPGELFDPSSAPTCAPESIVDFNTSGARANDTLTLTVDTRGARNDLHPMCAELDSSEVVLRYRVPPLADHAVQAIRVTTITSATIANAGDETNPFVPDPTTFDTVLSIRPDCIRAEANCNNDAFVPDGTGGARPTRRSDLYLVGVLPEDEMLVIVDGYDGNAGLAQVTLTEYPQLGVLGTPCVPIPPERALDTTAPTAYFRCPAPGIQCLPGAAPDGTDLCVPLVALGRPCDSQGHFNVCAEMIDGITCAQDPNMDAHTQCALPGTTAGASCRGGTRVVPCDAGLACVPSNDPRVAGVCVAIVNSGDTCDPAPVMPRNHCAAGLTCCAESPDAGSPHTCAPTGPACF